jgi:dihydroflavonol-4-reductase
VLGASGFLGLHVVNAFHDLGSPVTAGHRRAASMLLRKWRVPQAHADLDAPEQLVDALKGHQVVVHAAGHYPRRSLDPVGTLETGMRHINTVLNACAQAGVERIVYISTVATVPSVPGRASTEEDAYAEQPGVGAYHDVKWAMEQRVLQEDRFEVVVLCPGACLGPWDFRIGTAGPLVALRNGMVAPMPDGWVNVVNAADVGRAAHRCAYLPDLPRRLLVGGHDVRLHDWLVELSGRYGVTPPLPPLSAERAIAQSDAAERAAGPTERVALPREFVDLVLHGTQIDSRVTERALGMSWTSLDTTLHGFDTWVQRLKLVPQQPHQESP